MGLWGPARDPLQRGADPEQLADLHAGAAAQARGVGPLGRHCGLFPPIDPGIFRGLLGSTRSVELLILKSLGLTLWVQIGT